MGSIEINSIRDGFDALASGGDGDAAFVAALLRSVERDEAARRAAFKARAAAWFAARRASLPEREAA